MTQKLDSLQETSSQTAGPFVHIGMVPTYAGLGGIYEEEIGTSTFSDGAKGDVIEITGTIIDGAGFVMRDGMFEAWQADANGIYPRSGRCGSECFRVGTCVCQTPESRRMDASHDQARFECQPRRQRTGAAHRDLGRRAWHQHWPADPYLL